MKFISENYGPQPRINIELGDLVTLLVGPNNTGKSFVSRAIYAILRSCRGYRCDSSKLASLLLNTSTASEKDLWLVSRDFCGRFSLVLEDGGLGFKVKVDYDRSSRSPLMVEVQGEVKAFSALYVPATRVVSLGLLYMFAGFAVELKDVILKLASQLATTIGGAGKEEELSASMMKVVGLDSDLLHIFVRSVLSTLRPILEQRPDALKATAVALSPTLLDLAIAVHAAEGVGVDERLKRVFRDLFPEFPYKALGLYHSDRAEAPEIPPHLLSSGMIQSLPLLCLLNLALLHAEQGYERVFVFIDEPELNLELVRQSSFSKMLMDVVYSLRREGKRVSLIIATHSDFIAYSITRWLARNNLRDLARVYEFKPDGVEEREIDEYGEVELETFSRAVRKMFFEEEIEEE